MTTETLFSLCVRGGGGGGGGFHIHTRIYVGIVQKNAILTASLDPYSRICSHSNMPPSREFQEVVTLWQPVMYSQAEQ